MRWLPACTRGSLLALVVHPLASAAPLGRADPAFSSDRPGFANTSAIAATGRLTTELGWSTALDRERTTLIFPALSLRTGVWSWLELRMRAPNLVVSLPREDTLFALADPVLGFKVGGSPHPNIAISSVSEVAPPWGTDPLRAAGLAYSVDTTVDWRVAGPITLTPNAVVVSSAAARDDGLPPDRQFSGVASFKVTGQLHPAIATYVQSYAWMQEGEPTSVQLGCGLAIMVAPRVQVDASFDSRVTAHGDAPTVGVGMTAVW